MILVKWIKNGEHCGCLCNDLEEVRDILLNLTYSFSDDLIVDEVVLEKYKGE